MPRLEEGVVRLSIHRPVALPTPARQQKRGIHAKTMLIPGCRGMTYAMHLLRELLRVYEQAFSQAGPISPETSDWLLATSETAIALILHAMRSSKKAYGFMVPSEREICVVGSKLFVLRAYMKRARPSS